MKYIVLAGAAAKALEASVEDEVAMFGERFFQMLFDSQHYSEYWIQNIGEGKHFEAAVFRRRSGKARRFIFSIWAIEILTFKGQTIFYLYLPKNCHHFDKWRVKVVND